MGYLVPIQEETREGVTMRIHRFVEKRPVLRALPTQDPAVLHYTTETTDIHQLEIELQNGSALVEPGALQYMYGQLQAEVIRHENKGFLARAVSSAGTGESAYATKYTGGGKIWCEPSRKHFILATMDADVDALLLDDKAFYACSAGINLTTHRHSSVAGVLSGSGLVQPKLAGRGVFAVESPVPVEEVQTVELSRGQELVVDGDIMLMYSAALMVEIGPLVRGIRNAMRSGEGLVYRFRGEGTVWLTPTAKVS